MVSIAAASLGSVLAPRGRASPPRPQSPQQLRRRRWHAHELVRLNAIPVTVSTGLDRQAHQGTVRSAGTVAVTVSATDQQYSSAQEFRTVTLAVTLRRLPVRSSAS